MPASSRWILLAAAIAMPAVSYATQAGAFGGSVGDESSRFDTLIVPAGYAFSIWGLIFLLDVVFAGWQMRAARASGEGTTANTPSVRGWAAAGFALTAAWTPVFSQQAWIGAVLIIWLSLAALLYAARLTATADAASWASSPVARVPLALHAGWLSVAAFANTAQLALALDVTTASTQLAATGGLWFIATLLLVTAQRALAEARASLGAYTAAVVWGLIAVWVEQRNSALAGAPTSAWIAAALAAVMCLHGAWLLRRTLATTAPNRSVAPRATAPR